ncbi:MAG TPA: hypothetical protein VMU51_27150 [Mycobacteriales bacterium]|nr:hypothetical protein [Mycobacteriales bacterium]
MASWDDRGNNPGGERRRRRRVAVPVSALVVVLAGALASGSVRLAGDSAPTSRGLPDGGRLVADGLSPGGASSTGAVSGRGAAEVHSVRRITLPPRPVGPVRRHLPVAARRLPTEAHLLAQCKARIRPQDQPVSQDVRFLVATADREGYLVWIGGAQFHGVCASTWDGNPDRRSLLGLPTGGVVPGEDPPPPPGFFSLQAGGHAAFGPDRVMEFEGTVSTDIRRVVVRWAGGRPPTEAGVRQQYFLARRIEPDLNGAPSPTGDGCLLEAYDGAGQLVRRRTC